MLSITPRALGASSSETSRGDAALVLAELSVPLQDTASSATAMHAARLMTRSLQVSRGDVFGRPWLRARRLALLTRTTDHRSAFVERSNSHRRVPACAAANHPHRQNRSGSHSR